MKNICKSLIFAVISCISLSADADVIVKKDGTTMEVFNIEVGQKYVTYTKDSSPDSELGRISREQCFAIKTEDGDMKTLDAITSTSESIAEEKNTSTPTIKDAIAASDNQQIIDSYNTSTVNLSNYKEDPKKLHSGFSLMIWGIGTESILSDENMTINIEPIETTPKKNGKYQFTVQNKSGNNLYIDLTNSFKINSKGVAKPFYDSTVYSTSHGKDSGASLNLGAVTNALGFGGAVSTLASGITMGSGSSSVTQVTKTDQPILVVPPHSKVALPLEKSDQGNELAEVFYFAGSYYDFLDSYAPYAWGKRDYEDDGVANVYSSDINLHKNGFVEFEQNNSPKTYRFMISYSTDPEFKEVNRSNFSVFLRGIYGFKPASKSSMFSSTLKQIIMTAPQNFIWGFGTIQKGDNPDSKESKKALKEMLKAQ